MSQIFVPKQQVNRLKQFVHDMNSQHHLSIDMRSESFLARSYQPPTMFEKSDFTGPFQEIIDTYGVPWYWEVNPGLFTIVTFPYLFGFMFGDIGHGLALFLFGLFLIKNNTQLGQGSLKAVFKLRFMFTLMGFFAFFCGLIYNDFLSIPWNLFGSCYKRDNGKFI